MKENRIEGVESGIVNARNDEPSSKVRNIQEERAERKMRLASAFRVFAHFGFDEGVAGNITARDPEFTDTFWLNPFGHYFGSICVSDLIRVDKHGNVVEGQTDTVNESALILHSQIHERRPEINSVVHAHSIYGRTFSATGKTLRPLTVEATAFYDDHVVFGKMGGVMSQMEEGQMVAEALEEKKAMILANHGLLTVGRTVDEAAWWFIALERSCQTQLLAEAVCNPRELTEEEARRGYQEMGNSDAGWYQYQPLFQRILKEQPDFLR
jgi:ribulose-5-phosphate 4-epimerase/fuculose-1-phosphate aldolase